MDDSWIIIYGERERERMRTGFDSRWVSFVF